MIACKDKAIASWSAFGLAAFLLLPWHAVTEGLFSVSFPGGLIADEETASSLWQVLLFRRSGLLCGLIALVACFFTSWTIRRRWSAWLFVSAGFAGALALMLSGFMASAGVSGPGTHGRLSFGWGASSLIFSLLVIGSVGLARLGAFRGDAFATGVAVITSGVLLVFVAVPMMAGLGSAFSDGESGWSLTSGVVRMTSDRVWSLACLSSGVRCGVAWNTLFLAFITALGTTFMGTLLALAEYRSQWRFKGIIKLLTPLPLVTPPFIAGLALVLVFGRAGVVNQLLELGFGLSPSRWFYGLFGLWFAQMLAFTPVAFLIMRGVVHGLNPSLEQVAQTLRASPGFIYRRVTLPLLMPGLANAFLVGFLESVADFGNPIILGGAYAVLSTDIFFAIVGAQFDEGRAAALAWILALFALSVFAVQRATLGSRSYIGVDGRAAAGRPLALPSPLKQVILGFSVFWLVLTLGLYIFAMSAGLVENWGRDYTPTLRHFHRAFEVSFNDGEWALTGLAWKSLITTFKLAAIAACLTSVGGLMMAWLLERNQFTGRSAIELISLAAFAVPGTVLGLSYILVFNVPPIELTGTATIIVLCFLFRNLPVSVSLGSAALRQIDSSLDEASRVLGASPLKTLAYVLAPLLRPAIVASLIYSFVRSVTTVSAVVFLVTAETELATTFIITRVGQGDYGLAFAYSAALILLMSLGVALIQWLVGDVKLGRITRPGRIAGG